VNFDKDQRLLAPYIKSSGAHEDCSERLGLVGELSFHGIGQAYRQTVNVSKLSPSLAVIDLCQEARQKQIRLRRNHRRSTPFVSSSDTGRTTIGGHHEENSLSNGRRRRILFTLICG